MTKAEKQRAASRKWRRNHPEKVREGNRGHKLKSNYGISVAEYEEIFAKQIGACAICFSTNKNRRLSVDHDHRTGNIRGLLCGNCNRALGYFQDSSQILALASAYLAKHNLEVIR